MRAFRLAALAVSVVALAGSSRVAAQTDVASSDEPSPMVQSMIRELGHTAGDFWTPKLNDYKVRVDAMLSPADLVTLNRLRVRWAIVLDRGMQKLQKAKGVKQGDSTAEMVIEKEWTSSATELMEIYQATTQVSARYRSGLDRLGVNVKEDLGTFVDVVADRAEQFINQNRAAIESDQDLNTLPHTIKDLRSAAAEVKSGNGMKDIAQIYSFAIEPFVLLYNGVELQRMFHGISTLVGGNSASLASTTSTVESLPDMSALKQNFPNPASAATTIPYVIAEPSTATVLRLFNASGDLVATYDQGARAAGDYTADVDVSALPSGTYLYHLTVSTAKSQRVYSKTMVVVH